jgi:hypothetical protein
VGYGHGIKSGPVVVMDAKTIKIPAFNYDGKGGQVSLFHPFLYFFMIWIISI